MKRAKKAQKESERSGGGKTRANRQVVSQRKTLNILLLDQPVTRPAYLLIQPGVYTAVIKALRPDFVAFALDRSLDAISVKIITQALLYSKLGITLNAVK